MSFFFIKVIDIYNNTSKLTTVDRGSFGTPRNFRHLNLPLTPCLTNLRVIVATAYVDSAATLWKIIEAVVVLMPDGHPSTFSPFIVESTVCVKT